MKKNKIIGMLTSLLLVFSTFGSQIPVYAQEQTDTQEVNQNNGFTERKNYAGRQMLSWRNPEGG